MTFQGLKRAWRRVALKRTNKKQSDGGTVVSSRTECSSDWKDDGDRKIEFVKSYIQHMKDGKDIEPFFASHAMIVFTEAEMSAFDFVEEWRKLKRSFPDLLFHCISINSDPKDGSVLTAVKVSGTHTGEPYSFGPFPEIKAEGKKICIDEEVIRFTVSKDNNKFERADITPLGKESGPPGIYSQLGGILF